jgi:4-hydroxyphenylpyruvate dioxygenase
LPPEEIDRMRRLDILYDRDGAAEYRQAYTRSLADGFFFEIVERRSYTGFGAVNAPIRLAAQTSLARTPPPV